MPCGYHMNLEDGLVTITSAQAVEASQLHALGEQILADPGFDPYLPQLVDLRDIDYASGRGCRRAWPLWSTAV